MSVSDRLFVSCWFTLLLSNTNDGALYDWMFWITLVLFLITNRKDSNGNNR